MKNNTPKRIAAWVAVILLVGLYVVTFVVAVVYPPGAGNLFGACLMATVAVPLLAWIYIWLYGQMTGKKTIADLNLMQDSGEKTDAADTAGADETNKADLAETDETDKAEAAETDETDKADAAAMSETD